MARVNWADVVAIIIVIKSIYTGSHRGFFVELFYIFGIWFIIIFDLHFYLPVSNFINTYLFIPMNISGLISLIIIGVGIYIIFVNIYGFLQKVIKIEVFPAIDKIGGPLLGFCKGLIISSVFFLVLLLIPIGYITDSAKTRSLFSPFFIKIGTTLYQKSLSIVPGVEPRDITQLLSGAKPLKFRIFQFKRKDDLDEILQ